MPVAGQLDPGRAPGRARPVDEAADAQTARDVRVVNVVIPQSSGFSNETFLVDAAWNDDDGDHEVELVVRGQAPGNILFPESDLVTHQFRTMQLLGEHSDVPVARMRWAEADPGVIGRPFFVMDRLHGLVPGDSPPVHDRGLRDGHGPRDAPALAHQCAVRDDARARGRLAQPRASSISISRITARWARNSGATTSSTTGAGP